VWPPVSGARLHTHWCQFATGTGRLSSRNPNVQQVPKYATKLATDVTSPAAADPATGPSAAAPPSAAFTQPATVSVRSSFVAAPGVVFLSADYSQLEMRLMAQLSNDPRLQLELHAGGDLFRRVAGAWHRKAPEAISELERGHTKQLCYGLTYGLGVERMAASMQLTVPEAVQLRKGFLSSFPTLAQFTEHVRKLARTNLAVATLCGRKRPLPGITSENSSERAKAERQAVNSVVQGSAADAVKEAMVRCSAELERRGIRGRLIAQIHDELLFEVREADARTAAAIIKQCMEVIDVDGKPLPPLPVTILCGSAWGTMVPLA